jgi:3D (Asp-Asp-Asp) domain-containing protein
LPDSRDPAGPPESSSARRARDRAPRGPGGWRRLAGQLIGIAALFLVGFSLVWYGSSEIEPLPPPPVDATVGHAPVLVEPETRLPPVTVEAPPRDPAAAPAGTAATLPAAGIDTLPGTALPPGSIPGTAGTSGPLPPTQAEPRVPGKRHPVFDFDFGLDKPLLLRRRLPVQVTMYCLKGTTRNGLPTRPGIVAADPRVLPVGTVIDVYVGLRYYGRYLVDDTGGVIKGAIIDVWTPDCKDARRFGRRRGAVVLVQPKKKRR